MLLDNRNNGHVGNTLRDQLAAGSKLSVLSGLFTIYGFSALKKELARVDGARLLLSGWDGLPLQSLIGADTDLRLVNQLDQKRIARECAKWLAGKAEVRSANAAQNMFLVEDGSQGSFAIHGSSAFTCWSG